MDDTTKKILAAVEAGTDLDLTTGEPFDFELAYESKEKAFKDGERSGAIMARYEERSFLVELLDEVLNGASQLGIQKSEGQKYHDAVMRVLRGALVLAP